MGMSSEQNIRDYVLPLVEAQNTTGGWIFAKFHGTCFLIDNCSLALTNKHLLGAEQGNRLGVLTISKENSWEFHAVVSEHPHPEEDVAVIKFDKALSLEPSFLAVSQNMEFSSCEYMQWVYPEDATNELVVDDRVVFRPDLIYLQGYIRRRVYTNDDRCVYELSEPATTGCSGSPIINQNSRGSVNWQVIGIYFGNRKTTYDGYDITVGHAVISDAICNWVESIRLSS